MSVYIYHGDKIKASENLKQHIKDAVAVGMEIVGDLIELSGNCHAVKDSVVMYRHGACPITSTHAKEAYPDAVYTAWATVKNLKSGQVDFLMFYF